MEVNIERNEKGELVYVAKDFIKRKLPNGNIKFIEVTQEAPTAKLAHKRLSKLIYNIPFWKTTTKF